MLFRTSKGAAVPVDLCRRRNTRHLRIRLGHQNQIQVSAPLRCSEQEALAFVNSQRAWVEQQLDAAPASRDLIDWLRAAPAISASGDTFHVRIEPSCGIRASYTFECSGADLVLRIPDVEDAAAVLRLVRRFAKDALYCRTAYQAKRLGLTIPTISVRDQVSRWGSCSSAGALSLNWRLVLLQPQLQDYVILHELAHLTEMNHSKRFWALLDQYDPHRVEHEAELDRIGPAIMRVGR